MQSDADAVSSPVDAGYEFDICYTSVLKRAIRTLWLVLDGIDQMWLPVHRTWRLTSVTTVAWRGSTRPRRRPNTARRRWRSGDAPMTPRLHPWTPSTTSTPPSARWASTRSVSDRFLKGHVTLNVISLQDRRYGELTEDQLPSCESLKDTIARALPFWNEEIVPQIKEGKRVLIAAHGNSLRGIVKHLEGEKTVSNTLKTRPLVLPP